ncbi:unnamed protein product [Pipistrellus nathusii]|uniref:Secreted protein n=1 Tax=Pipistrellus nathusii TaxID=59473 RepID=A0ABN9ZCT3_PIPNA
MGACACVRACVRVCVIYQILNLSSCLTKLWRINVHICQVFCKTYRTEFFNVLVCVFIKQIYLPLKIHFFHPKTFLFSSRTQNLFYVYNSFFLLQRQVQNSVQRENGF